uniref:Uncharacterized protein n=1 Tax=Cryptomonas curvata TaxID=233186 RepID=A0A7S0N620_9CRYP|mmetsp:Transcript_6621/g.14432  ORF Transcript_6621/g.14432 Transcript_6621/m.14432 type:complete len:104 (+) Transcript_6621:1-312(+)
MRKNNPVCWGLFVISGLIQPVDVAGQSPCSQCCKNGASSCTYASAASQGMTTLYSCCGMDKLTSAFYCCPTQVNNVNYQCAIGGPLNRCDVRPSPYPPPPRPP